MDEEKKVNENNNEEVSGIDAAEKNLVEIFSEESKGEQNLENNSNEEESVVDNQPSESTNVVSENPSNGGNFDGPKNKKIWTVVLGIILAILVVACALTLLGVFDSKGKVFAKRLTDKNLAVLPSNLITYSTKSGTYNSKVIFNIDEITKMLQSAEGTEDENNESTLKKVTLTEVEKVKGFDLTSNVKIDADGEQLIELNVFKFGEMVGLNIPGITDEYLAIKNENLKALAKKLGIDDEKVPDKIDLKNLESLVKTSYEDYSKYEKLLKKYLPVIEKEVSDYIEEEKDVVITINGKDVKTNKDFIKLNYERLFKLYKAIFTKAQNDEEFYNFYIESTGTDEITSFSEWQEYVTEYLKEIDDVLNDETIEFPDSNICLSTYQNGGKTVAIEISLNGMSYYGDMDFRYAVENTKDGNHVELLMQQDDSKFIVSIDAQKTKNGYEGNAKISYDISDEKQTINFMNFTTEYDSKVDSFETISEDKCFILNDKSEEQIQEKFEQIGENAETFFENISDKLPEDLFAPSYDYDDYDYDYDYDDYDYDYDYDYYDDDYDYDYDHDYDYYDYDFEDDYEENSVPEIIEDVA